MPEAATPAPTRVKYRCAGCAMVVWGKPELDIRFGRCGRVLKG